MRQLSVIVVGWAICSGITHAQETVSITVDANRSCMPWSLQDLATAERFGSDCPGFDEVRQFVRGSCTFELPAAEPYQFQWGGQFAWPIRIMPDGLIEYRTPQEVDSLQPGTNSITLNTSRVRLRPRGFPGVFGLEFDNVPCDEDPDPAQRERRLFVVNGARFLIAGSFTPPGEPTINTGSRFRVRADGQLEKVVSASDTILGFTQDPFINGRNPNRVIVNRAFWNYEPATKETDE